MIPDLVALAQNHALQDRVEELQAEVELLKGMIAQLGPTPIRNISKGGKI